MITFRQLRPLSVGFDDFFNFAESLASLDIDNFPKYDIVKHNETNYAIEMALAGYSEEDLDISYQEGTLSISHKKEVTKEDKQFLHRGITKRAFNKTFTLAENVKVVDASFINGLLVIQLERIVPEEKKPRKIPISTTVRNILR